MDSNIEHMGTELPKATNVPSQKQLLWYVVETPLAHLEYPNFFSSMDQQLYCFDVATCTKSHRNHLVDSYTLVHCYCQAWLLLCSQASYYFDMKTYCKITL